MSLFVLVKVCAIIGDMHEEHVTEERGVPRFKAPRKNNFLGILLALILAAGSFVSGLQVDSLISKESQSASLFSFFTNPAVTSASENPDLTQFWRVWNLLDEKFIAASSTNSLTAEDKINGAIEGMVATYGDPYTVFLPPVESAAFAEDISGNFSGIGMEVGIRDNVVTIIAPLPDTPAERAGLISGDIITRINDTSTEGMRIDEAVKMIRGEKGTEVRLSIYREGDTEIREIVVVRDTISIPTVVTEMVDGVFVIRLYSFNALA